MGKRPPAPPPPPPDYTQEKAEWAAAELAKRQTTADAYNTAVGQFNTSLANQGAGINTMRDTLGGLTIADLDDNAPDYAGQVADLRSGLNALQFNQTRPTWQGAMQSPYGSVSVGIPTLNQVNENMRTNYLGEIGGLSNRIADLNQRRGAEERRVTDYRSQALGNLGQLTGQIGRQGIGTQTGIDALSTGLDAIRSRLAAFNSPIASQMYSDGAGGLFPTINQQLGTATTNLSGLQGRRDTELGRIADFRTQQQQGYDALSARYDPLTIVNEQGLKDLQRDIDAQQLGINRFTSDIATDFNPTMSNLLGLEGKVGSKMAEREAELARIEQAQNLARTGARGLLSSAEGADMYNLNALDSLGDTISDAQEDISGFSSLLPYDFGTASERLTGASDALQALRDERATNIDDFLGRAETINTGAADYSPYDEAGMREGLSSLMGIGADLAPYSGGRVGDVNAAIETARSSIDQRLDALNTERDTIETNAQALLESVGATNFSDLNAITEQMDALGLIEEKQQLYAAVQALDEIEQIRGRLQGEKQRLETDHTNSAAALQAERDQILAALGPGGVPQFQDFTSTSPMTASEYLAMLARKRQEEEQTTAQTPSGFSGNLGVIQV